MSWRRGLPLLLLVCALVLVRPARAQIIALPPGSNVRAVTILDRAPTPEDDSVQRYVVGSVILDTSTPLAIQWWQAMDVTPGAAQWACFSCNAQSGGSTLQAAFNAGNTIETTVDRALEITEASGLYGKLRLLISPAGPTLQAVDASGNILSSNINIPLTSTFTLTYNGNDCLTVDAAGAWTLTGACRWTQELSLSAGALTVDGANCVSNSVALNSWPAEPLISCADNDTGYIVARVDRLPFWFDAGSTVTLTAQAYTQTNQNGLTISYDVQHACVAAGEQRPAVPATGDLADCTITFGSTSTNLRAECTHAFVATGCAAGEELLVVLHNRGEGTATQPSTTAGLTGISLRAFRVVN